MNKYLSIIFLLLSFTPVFGQGQICSFVVKEGQSVGVSQDTPCPLFSVVKFPQALFVADAIEKSGRSLDDLPLTMPALSFITMAAIPSP